MSQARASELGVPISELDDDHQHGGGSGNKPGIDDDDDDDDDKGMCPPCQPEGNGESPTATPSPHLRPG